MFKEDLHTLFCSNGMRPDVSVCIERHGAKLPTCLFQVDSKTFSGTISKLCRLLITQLRYVRNYSLECDKVVGFCFPKSAVASAVAKVTVKWDADALSFVPSFERIEIAQLQTEIRAAHTEVARFYNMQLTKMKCGFAIPIDARMLVHPKFYNTQQCPSHTSILLKGDRQYFKFAFDSDQREVLLSALMPLCFRPKKDIGSPQNQ